MATHSIVFDLFQPQCTGFTGASGTSSTARKRKRSVGSKRNEAELIKVIDFLTHDRPQGKFSASSAFPKYLAPSDRAAYPHLRGITQT